MNIDPSGHIYIYYDRNGKCVNSLSEATRKKSTSIQIDNNNGTVESQPDDEPENTDPEVSQSSIDPIAIYVWLTININIIWRHPPSFMQDMFLPTGRRILSVDPPHGGKVDYYHLNTDLKLIYDLVHHKNIQPFIGTVVGIVNTISNTALRIVNTISNTAVRTVNTISSTASSVTESVSPFVIITEDQFQLIKNPPWQPQFVLD